MKREGLYRLVLSALFLALGLILPFFTGQIPQVGKMLLPMHIPVLLCGLVCSWRWGLAVGFVVPLLRSLLFGMPPPYPTAVAMAFELAAYGFVAGWLYHHSHWKCLRSLYRSMLPAMVVGRVVWGAVTWLLLTTQGSVFTWEAFVAGALIEALPGIALQLVLIPGVMVSLGRTKLVVFHRSNHPSACERTSL